MLENVEIAAAIDEGNKTAAERAGVTSERVLQELARIAFLNGVIDGHTLVVLSKERLPRMSRASLEGLRGRSDRPRTDVDPP